MSDDLNIDFSQARAEVDQTVKAIDWLTLSVEKLNRAKVTDIKTALASLEAKGVPGIEASLTNTFSNLNKLEGMLVKSGDNVKKHSEKSAKELLASITLSFEQIQAAVVTHLTGVNALHRRAAETKLAMQQATDATSARAQEKLADIQLKADRVFTAATIAEAKRRADGILAQENRARVGGRTNAFGVFISDSQTASQAASAGSLSAGSNGSASAAAARSRVGSTDTLGLYRDAIPSTSQLGKVSELSAKFKQLSIDGNDVHSMARGLASGFNLLWLTWGNLLPLFAGAGISFGLKKTFDIGSEIEYLIKHMEVLGQTVDGLGKPIEGMGSAIRQELRNIDQTTLFTMEDLAKAMVRLGQAGQTPAEALQTLRPAADLAAVGMTDLKTATDLLIQTQALFGLSSKDSTKVAAQIFQITKSGVLNVEDIAGSMKYASEANTRFGKSLEETLAILGALAKAGLKGSSGGTSLINFYRDLNGRSGPAIKALKQLEKATKTTIEVFKADGTQRSGVDIFTDIANASEKLKAKDADKLLANIFSDRGGRAFFSMIREGTIDLKAMVSTLENVDPNSLFNAARGLMDTTKGAMNILQGALVGSLDQVFEAYSSGFKGFITDVTAIVSSDNFKLGVAGMVDAVLSLYNLIKKFSSELILFFEVWAGFKVISAGIAIFQTLARTLATASTAMGMGVGAAYRLTNANAAATAATIAHAEAQAVMATTMAATTARATLAASAMRGMVVIAAFLANPIVGLVTTVGLLAYTFSSLEGSADTAMGGTADSVVKNGKIIEGQLDREIKKLTDRNNLLLKGEAAAEDKLLSTLKDAQGALAEKYSKASAAAETESRPLMAAHAKREAAAILVEMSKNEKLINSAAEKIEASRLAIVKKGEKDRLDAQAKADKEAARLAAEAAAAAGSGGGRTNRATLREMSKDRLAALESEGSQRLQLLNDRYSKERQVLEAYHSSGMVGEGAYQYELLSLITGAEDSRLEQLRTANQTQLEEVERVGSARIKDYLHNLQMFKGTEAEKAAFRETQDKKLIEANEATMAAYAANSQRHATEAAKIETDKFLRMEKAAADYYGVIFKLKESSRLNSEKQTREQINQQALMELEERYSLVTESVTAVARAEKAAEEAGLTMTFKVAEQLAAMDDQIKKANASLEEFRVLSILNGKATDPEVVAALERQLATVKALQEARDAAATTGAESVANAASNAYKRVIAQDVKKLKESTSDALVTALFEGGKAGAKKLRSLLLAELRKPVTMVINAVVNTMMGSVTGALSGSAGSAMMGSVTGALSGSAGSAGGSMLSSAGAGLGSQFMTGLSAWGEGGSAATVIQGAMGIGEGAGLYSVMEGIGAASPYILAAYAAYKILTSATKDTIPSIEGGFASTGGLLGSANGKNYENGAYGGLIDSIAKTVGTGVVDSYGSTVRALGGKAGKLDVQNFIGLDQGGDSQNAYAIDAQLNGQWLYNRWTDQGGNNYAGKTDAEMTAAQDLSSKKIVLEALKATGLGPLLDDYLQTVTTNGKTLAEITAYFTDLTTLNAVKQMIEKMPLSLSYLNKEGHAAILGLVKIAGSLENLTGAVDNYYSLFATTGEKLADSTASTTTALAKLGLSMPTEGLREWYRVQVAASGAQDLSIESNAVAYYSLLKLASSVDEVAKAAEESAAVRQTWQDKLNVLLKRTTEKEISLKADLASTTDVATQALIRQVYAQEALVASTDTLISDTKSAFDRAADAERDRINLLISDQEKVVDSLKSVFDFLTSEMKSLYAEVLGSASSASAQFYSILAVAQQTGVLPEESVLRDAVSLARSSVTGAVYGSQTEARYAKLVLAGQLRQLADIAGPQLTDAEKTLDLYKAQLTSLEEMVKKADAIVNKLTGVEDGIGNVTVLLARLVELQTTVKVATAATATTAVFGGTATGTNVNQPVGGYVYNPDDFGGLSAEEYNRKVKGILSSLGNVPQLDVGTNYVPHDMLAMLHKGEAVVPPAYNHESGLSQNSEKALQLIAAEVAQMRRDNIALAADMAKVAKAFNGQQGAPIRVEVMQ